jgi:DNA-binding MarR family transcriptional regulator
MVKNKKNKDKKDKSKKVSKGNIMESIQHVHFLYERTLENTFNEFGLSNEQFRILKILQGAPDEGYTLRNIRESLPNQTSNATRLVEKLRVKKLLLKKSSRMDKRELRISLTPAGKQVLDDASLKINSLDQALSAGIKTKNAKGLFETLFNIAEILTQS